EIFLLRVTAYVGERHYRDRRFVGERRISAGPAHRRAGLRYHSVDGHRPGEVLQPMLSDLLESEFEARSGVLLRAGRDADAAGVGQASRRAATLTPSPKMSPSSAMMSPTLMPMRKSMRRSVDDAALLAAMALCTSAAQRKASMTLVNSTRRPSPVVLTM